MKPRAVAPRKRITSATTGCTVASAQSDANNNSSSSSSNFSSLGSISSISNMTLEEVATGTTEEQAMQTVEQALEELLVGAHKQGDLTVGVYESAKLLNADPDSVVLCLLAADADEESDLALQIHFTLIQAFCGDNDIDVIRVRGVARLAQLLCGGDGGASASSGTGVGVVGAESEGEEEEDGDNATTTSPSSAADEPRDLHCLLLTSPLPAGPLRAVASFCAESRYRNQWVPSLSLTER
ncbi:growth arrest and DNA damage-inducible protein GADD45 beta-like [Petromyzon marinus]|uniref:growth arrest and DNA damage-inducible protein GADD45 beta-like n=1 Tax=Petromyzon marinus TaxID=7757 RepID=UPI003F72E6C8